MDLDYEFPQASRPQTSTVDGEQQRLLSPSLSSTPTEFVDYGGDGQCIGLAFPFLCQPLGYPASMSGESLWAYPSMVHDDHVAAPTGGVDPVSSSVTSISAAEILLQIITSVPGYLGSGECAFLFLAGHCLTSSIQSYNHRFIGEYELFVAPSSLLESDENLSLRLVHTKKGTVVAKLFGEMFRAHIVASHDIADAAELLFEHRWSNGYMIGLNTLLSTAGDEICRYAAQPRIFSLAQHLEDFKVEYGILGISRASPKRSTNSKRFRKSRKMKTLDVISTHSWCMIA